MFPSMQNCSGKSSLTLANQKPNALIVTGNGAHYVGSPVAAVVVDNQDFVLDFERIQYATNTFQQEAKILGFAKSRNDQGKLLGTSSRASELGYLPLM